MLMNRKHTSFDSVSSAPSHLCTPIYSRVGVSLKVCSLPVFGSSGLPAKKREKTLMYLPLPVHL